MRTRTVEYSTANFEQFCNDLQPFGVGFDGLKETLKTVNERFTSQTYPPHNIIRKGDENTLIELAVAGFAKDDLTISLKDGDLVIKGHQPDLTPEEDVSFLHRGLARRNFEKAFRLNETVEVNGVDLKDGILRIYLEHLIPEHAKPKDFKIGWKKSTPKKVEASK